ncbi:ABC transporter substrate-binding protein [Paenibacillus sp. J2TS4]|uniref:ABC transporter substrate-binding protein n=1 Tax=Paenibacillus sp. J2TS4 TaxID=2807194 RepID=UPI001B0E6A21|nr:extracellular solute-binding protein [Paenibacillus sp. J2TS4]GIP36157.1 hypothetical protein J2TS4_53670 [Paenibacillus sp. J2TS4]
MIKRKLWASALSLSLLVPTLSACSFTGAPKEEPPSTLRIATTSGWFDEEYFRREYTELFELEHKNITVEFVNLGENYRYSRGPSQEEPEDPLKKLKDEMQGANPPDVVLFNYDQMSELVHENLLSPLDPMIKDDKFNTEDIVPAVIDGIKQMGNGQIYALSPTFYSSALVYNKGMFDEAGVGYPTDGMNWDEIFELARRVSKGDGKQHGFNFYSYSHGDLFNATQMYANAIRLRTFDENGEKMTVDSDSWEQAWKTIIDLGKEKTIPFMDMNNDNYDRFNDEGPFGYNDFLSGRLAMTMISLYEIKELINANKEADNIEGYTPIQWDIVSVPTAPDGTSYSFGFNDLMGINAKAPNAKVAWEYIKFMNGEDWARLKSRSSNNLISNKKYTKRSDGEEYNIEAFYNVKPAPPESFDDYEIYRKKPNIHEVVWMGQKYFNEAVEGQTSIRDALKAWQEEGDALLLQMEENPEASSVDRGGSEAIAVPIG